MRELASHCTFGEYRENRIRLNLQPGQEHLLTMNQKDKLEAALSLHCGAEIKLAITSGESGQETPAQRSARNQLEKKQAALEAVENNPDVKLFVDMFDATIDRESIRYPE